jgi:hypothetical protein
VSFSHAPTPKIPKRASPEEQAALKPIFYSVCWFLTNFPHGCDLRLNLVVPTIACFFLDSAI